MKDWERPVPLGKLSQVFLTGRRVKSRTALLNLLYEMREWRAEWGVPSCSWSARARAAAGGV